MEWTRFRRVDLTTICKHRAVPVIFQQRHHLAAWLAHFKFYSEVFEQMTRFSNFEF